MTISLNDSFDPTSRTAITAWVKERWDLITERAGTLPATLPKGSLRASGSSVKIDKGAALGSTAVVYGAPHSSAFASPRGGTECVNSTPECRATCLGTEAGRMVMSPVANARGWKTTLRRGAPAAWVALLALDVKANERTAQKAGLPAYFRADGSTDGGDGEVLSRSGMFPGTTFYDYTKDVDRAFRSLGTGYRVTLSFTGRNRTECLEYLRRGGNVAVVTDYAPGDVKADRWEGFPTVDGDEHDIRPIDPPGHAVLLSWKGPRAGLDVAGPFVERLR
jgi:hypothetical protein